ncbi:hypothetical protein JM83_1554 [Gillisia sp. Hel_I_86]|nr:hypothetical protein JM83_1543 [Gillisia sp. Hel_I_86]TVZ26579.1 hypothetical protein JM83_1554 [Gillisia sp. Hel_I_86]
MGKIWITVIAISIFLIITLIYWKFTRGTIKTKYDHNWKIWGARTFYWQDAIYTITGITFLILVTLKWTDILTF